MGYWLVKWGIGTPFYSFKTPLTHWEASIYPVGWDRAILHHFVAVFPASNLLLLKVKMGCLLVKIGCRLVKLVVQCLCMWNKMDLAISSLFLSFLSFLSHFAGIFPAYFSRLNLLHWGQNKLSKNCENDLFACKNGVLCCKIGYRSSLIIGIPH